MTLEEFMSKKGLSDDAMAVRLGVSRAHVSRLRRGVSRPSWDLAMKIQSATKNAVRPNDVLRTAEVAQ